MPPLSRLGRLRALPSDAFDELYRADDTEQTYALAERYGLKKEQEEALSNTLSDVFLKDVALEKLPATFSERLKVSEDVAKKIAVDVAGTRLLKLSDYFGDVPARILEWGGDPTNFLSIRAFDENAAKVLAEEIAKKLSLTLAPDALGKLAAMVGSRVRGVRDDSEFKEALARPSEKGGIAAAAETAQKIIAEVGLFLKKEKEKPAPTAVGGAPPIPQPPAEATTVSALLAWVITASGLKFEGPLAKRFAEILESRLDGTRDVAAFKEVLVRGTKVGGLGLDVLGADKVVQLVGAAARMVRERDRVRETPPKVSESESQKVSYSSSGAQRSREVRESVSQSEVIVPKAPSPTPQLLGATHEAMIGGAPQPKKEQPQSIASSFSSSKITNYKLQIPKQTPPSPSEDELEIATETQALPAKVPMDVAAMFAKLQDATAAVIRLFGFQFPNPDIQKRFENTVSARLRDLRDAVETAGALARPVSEGGVGLTPEQLKAMAPILEEHVRAFQAELQIEKRREFAEWRKGEAAQSREKQLVKESAEGASRDALLARITAKSKKAQRAAATSDKRQATSPAPPARSQSSPRSGIPFAGQIANPPRADVPSAISYTPSAVMRPKMQDVRFTPKLVGPVEELRGITLTDFRRLSKDPKEAAVKIRDKVDLLGQESYTQRITAVTAWQESEVYQLYLEVLRGSLGGGRPVKEIIADKTATGTQTLTEPEFAAIMELSRTLRL